MSFLGALQAVVWLSRFLFFFFFLYFGGLVCGFGFPRAEIMVFGSV